MVTFGSLEEKKAFLQGKLRLNQEELSSEDWLMIAREAVSALHMNILQGMKTLGQVLVGEQRHGVERRLPSPFPMPMLESGMDTLEVPANRKFLRCLSQAPFPNSFASALRIEVQGRFAAVPDRVLSPITHEHLLLSRERKFVLLRARWLPKEKGMYDEYRQSGPPHRFWYELDTSPGGIHLCEPYDEEISQWFERLPHPGFHPALILMAELSEAARETERHHRSLRNLARSSVDTIQAISFRVGGP